MFSSRTYSTLMRILLVEDDKMIAETIRSGLIEQHYYVDVAHDGQQGEDLAWSNDYDLIILDIMLPKIDGKEVCRSLRREGVQIPILMLTALASESDIIAGLD